MYAIRSYYEYISTEKNSDYVHINFSDGSSDTNAIKKSLYEWYQLKNEGEIA